jgi:lipopolysaccharide heptosyltransferase I
VKRLLVVRMSALGDIVHALPVLAAIHDANVDIEVDWLADRKYAAILEFVDGLAQIVIGRPGLSNAVAAMRRREYDVAIDLQGLLKSAAMARLSGAKRVVGFDREGLREPAAGWFYSDSVSVPAAAHIIAKNLAVLAALDVPRPAMPRFPFVVPPSAAAEAITESAHGRGFAGVALVNPGAAWPNKRWPPERYGAVARHISEQHRLLPVVLWGGGEGPLADSVVAASSDAAVRAPETTIGDLLALSSRAALMVSGDTGPLHIAAALGTSIVGLYGPTWPERNGPWRADDVVVSRAAGCECHHKRRCRRDAGRAGGESRMCLNEIGVADVIDAVDRRMMLRTRVAP